MSYRDLTPQEAHDELTAAASDPESAAKPKLLDVRTQPEYNSHRLADATLLPVQELQQRIGELDAQENWFVYCEHGVRSVAACEFLAANGFANVTNIRGGMAHWAAAGMPYERGR
ncbi:MAG: rhodanese-like domain-containing protein [Planctomycetota bacterium]